MYLLLPPSWQWLIWETACYCLLVISLRLSIYPQLLYNKSNSQHLHQASLEDPNKLGGKWSIFSLLVIKQLSWFSSLFPKNLQMPDRVLLSGHTYLEVDDEEVKWGGWKEHMCRTSMEVVMKLVLYEWLITWKYVILWIILEVLHEMEIQLVLLLSHYNLKLWSLDLASKGFSLRCTEL